MRGWLHEVGYARWVSRKVGLKRGGSHVRQVT